MVCLEESPQINRERSCRPDHATPFVSESLLHTKMPTDAMAASQAVAIDAEAWLTHINFIFTRMDINDEGNRNIFI